jgi:hypothetical protein
MEVRIQTGAYIPSNLSGDIRGSESLPVSKGIKIGSTKVERVLEDTVSLNELGATSLRTPSYPAAHQLNTPPACAP